MPRRTSGWFAVALAASLGILVPTTAPAGLFVGAEVRETYEDNVIGLVSDNPNIAGNNGTPATIAAGDDRNRGRSSEQSPMKENGGGNRGGGRDDNLDPVTTPEGTTAAAPAGGAVETRGDFSTTVSADLGADHDLSDNTALLLIAGASHTTYQTFSEFDFTIAELKTGVTQDIVDGLSGRFLLEGAKKKFRNSLRDSTAYGFSVSLKQRFTPAIWLRVKYDLDWNNADSPLYDYRGNSLGLRLGFVITPKSSLGFGYSILSRTYTEPPAVELTTRTISLNWTWSFVKSWSVSAAYDRERADATSSGAALTNNIYSLGLLFDY